MNADAPNPFGWKCAADVGLTFRRIEDADLAFLARVYASTAWRSLRARP